MIPEILRRAPEFLSPIAVLYGMRLKTAGTGPRGVFWRDEAGQRLRFEVLARAIEDRDADAGGITVNDLGCGYGAFFEYLRDTPCMRDSRFYGYDICEDMVAKAVARVDDERAFFAQSLIATVRVDYSFASGTYNLNADVGEQLWLEYVHASIRHLWSMTEKTLAFNMLDAATSVIEEGLYYADRKAFAAFCGTLAEHVTVIDDYPLNEFTVFLRR
jgi:SAM-dependent methyltransferase